MKSYRSVVELDKAVKTRNTSTRLASNNADGVARLVYGALPDWRSYPRCLRVVFGQLYRFGSLEECLDVLALEIESFSADWDKYVTGEQKKRLDDVAAKWYSFGTLPKGRDKQISFTEINQQLFYEATLSGNARVALGVGGSSDVKLATEGGYGNHLEVERLRHNTMRKADAELAAREAVEAELLGREDSSDIFGGKEVEFIPIDEQVN